jgi:hypothetical protein
MKQRLVPLAALLLAPLAALHAAEAPKPRNAAKLIVVNDDGFSCRNAIRKPYCSARVFPTPWMKCVQRSGGDNSVWSGLFRKEML